MTDWTEKYRQELDRLAMANLGAAAATTSTTQANAAFSFARLKEVMEKVADMPPPPLFASSRMFPAGHSIRFKRGRREYCGAHPDFWEEAARQIPEMPRSGNPLLGAIDIIDLDLSANEALRGEFLANLSRAMDEQS